MTVRRGGAEAHPRVLCGNADLSFELVKVCSLLPSQLCFRFFFFFCGGGVFACLFGFGLLGFFFLDLLFKFFMCIRVSLHVCM